MQTLVVALHYITHYITSYIRLQLNQHIKLNRKVAFFQEGKQDRIYSNNQYFDHHRKIGLNFTLTQTVSSHWSSLAFIHECFKFSFFMTFHDLFYDLMLQETLRLWCFHDRIDTVAPPTLAAEGGHPQHLCQWLYWFVKGRTNQHLLVLEQHALRR